jgi:regulator of protease activity HflC (stomatin/prohibitin superfamily)
MADIRRVPFLRHYRGTPTVHVIHLRNGQVRHAGTGRSFWFRPLAAAISEVPVDDRELPLLFHARTADHQNVSVQATVGYRFADPETAAARLDLGVDVDRGGRLGEPLDQVALLLTELAQQYALDLIAAMPLTEALVSAVAAVRARVAEGLAADERLRQTGITVVGVRVVAIRPDPDLERALQTPTREQVQQEADRATYERRALAVERERAISENELQSQIELAVREEQLVAQRGANARREATEKAAAGRIAAESGAEQDRLRAAGHADRVRTVGLAEADADRARMAVHAGADPRVLLALAVRDGAALPEIGSLTITPDLLTGLLARLGSGTPPAAEQATDAEEAGRR